MKKRAEKAVKERFIHFVDVTDGCWSWIGNHDKRGYGMLCVRHEITGRWTTKHAHRISYELFKGFIPEGMQVLHNCVNPDHLRIGTQADNIREAFDKGRATQIGEENSCHKLTGQDVINIKRSSHSQLDLATPLSS